MEELDRRSKCLRLAVIMAGKTKMDLEAVYIDLLAFADTEAKLEGLLMAGHYLKLESTLAEATMYADLLEPPRSVSKPAGGRGSESRPRRPSIGRGRGRGRGRKDKDK